MLNYKKRISLFVELDLFLFCNHISWTFFRWPSRFGSALSTWYSCQAAEVRAFPNPLCLELSISAAGSPTCPKLSISSLSASFGLFHRVADSSWALPPN